MPEGYTVSTDVVRQAADTASQAHQFFNTALTALQEALTEATGSPLDGGYGQTGGYQSAIRAFGTKYCVQLGEFVQDEVLFVKFLAQLHAKLTQTASLYDETEARNTQRLTELTNRLDGQDG